MFDFMTNNAEKMHGFVNKQFVKKFITYFAGKDNWHNLDSSKGNMGYGFIHYSLLRVWHPKSILCIGSKYGYVPAVLALGCKEDVCGHVDFVDANYDEQSEDHWGGVGYWSSPQGRDAFEKFGLKKYITTYVQTTKVFKQANPKKKWDYIYFDGNHSYEGVKNDFELFYPSLQKGGLLLFHDIYLERFKNLNYGVKKFIHELEEERIFSILKIPGQFGLAVIQKNEK